MSDRNRKVRHGVGMSDRSLEVSCSQTWDKLGYQALDVGKMVRQGIGLGGIRW